MAATTASEYLQTSVALVNRVPLSNVGIHIHVVLATSLDEGFIFAVLLPSEVFDWGACLADDTRMGADAVFAGNKFQWMKVMYKNAAGIVASCVGDTPSVHVPEGPLVFTNMQHALVLVGWFQTGLEASGAIATGRKRAAEGTADGGPAAARAREELQGSTSGETSTLSAPAPDARRGPPPVLDLDGTPHEPPASGPTADNVENAQFLIRMFDGLRQGVYLKHHVFRGDLLLENAFQAVKAGADTELVAPGLQALQNLRTLPILRGGAGEGSLLHGCLHGKWKVDDMSVGSYLDFVTADTVSAADFLPGVGSDDGRAVLIMALRNFERFLCAVFGQVFSNVFHPLREALENGEAWSRFDNVLVARNVHVMLVRWASDVHRHTHSVLCPSMSMRTPGGCAALLTSYVVDLLSAVREQRVADDWCAGGHIDFYREERGRFWFLVHLKMGGVYMRKAKAAPKALKTLDPPGAERAGEDAAVKLDPKAGTRTMRDGQRNVCSLHLCGALLHIKGQGPLRCALGKERCPFWHPTQLTQMTRSQALAALSAAGVARLPALAAAAGAAVNASGLIWKAEPVKQLGRK
ncbi:hypothetical protein B484DRAFT_472153 [Ochromonadaceae sp. CCMP2298]|nr:hypothetical protein B484DRAFT_472153 [Ochromonadaceae sp. CCMP2298]